MGFSPATRMGHGTKIGRAHELRVFPQNAGIVIGLARLPFSAALGQFLIGKRHINRALAGINDDLVAILVKSLRHRSFLKQLGLV